MYGPWPLEVIGLANTLVGRRILLVDDDRLSRLLTLTHLEGLGCQVVVLGDGRTAVDAEATGGFDAILMDCQMPLMDGFEATAAIRQNQADGSKSRTPIIGLSGRNMAGDAEIAIAKGMDAYLTKPVRIGDLRAALERWATEEGAAPGQPTPAGSDDVNLASRSIADQSIDEEVLAELFDVLGDAGPGAVADACDVFLADVSTGMEEIGASLAGRRMDQTARLAHRLRGGAGAFGACRVHQLAGALERACTEGDEESAEQRFDELRSEVVVIGEMLRSRLRRQF